MTVQAVIFDLDGTLLDTLDDLTDAVNATMRHFGCPEKTQAQVRKAVGNGAAKLLERTLPPGFPDFPTVLAWYKAYYAAHTLGKTAPYPGILPLLTALHRAGVPVAVVSNKQDDAVKSLCARFFGPLVAEAIGEKPGVRTKPAPDTLLAALAHLGTAAEHTLYVGDSEVDIQTASAAGLGCLSVTWGFRDAEILLAAGAERLFATPEALSAFLGL